MSKGANHRKAVQMLTCREVLSKFLDGPQLEQALLDLRDAMRHGPQAWAFKRAADETQDEDRTYYETGGAT